MAKTKKSTAATKSKKQKLETPVLTEAEKRIVMIQYEKENDSEDAQAILAEYLKFMQIKIGEQGTNDCCAPSKSIDEVRQYWIELFPKISMSTCWLMLWIHSPLLFM